MLVEHILCHALKGCLLYKKKKDLLLKIPLSYTHSTIQSSFWGFFYLKVQLRGGSTGRNGILSQIIAALSILT